MVRYVGRRLLMALPVLLGTSFLIFAMVYALPGDPIRALAGDQPLPPEVIAQLRAEHNLDDPLLLQYVKYLGQLFQGNLGTDFAGNPVAETIALRLPITARLAIVERAHRLLDTGRQHAVQSTTGSRRRGENTWVHGRSGRPCRRCGGTVRVAMIGPPTRERTMFYCPACQGGLAPTDDGRPQRPLGSGRRTQSLSPKL